MVHAVGELNLRLQLSGNKDGQTDNESVKTTRPGRLSMAGFQVTTHGRFSGDHRGRYQGDRNLSKIRVIGVSEVTMVSDCDSYDGFQYLLR